MRNKNLFLLVLIPLILSLAGTSSADDDLPGGGVTGTSDGVASLQIDAYSPGAPGSSSSGGRPTERSEPSAKKITLKPTCDVVGPALEESYGSGQTCSPGKCPNGRIEYARLTEDTQTNTSGYDFVCGLSESDPGSLAIDEFYKSTVKVSLPSAAPPAVTLAQFPNIFWSDVKTYEEPTGITVADVRLKFLPVKYVWNFGDGKSMTTTDPGKPYDPALAKTTQDAEKNYKNIHRYGMTGTFNVTLTVVFNGQYSVNGGDWIDIAGSVQATSPSRPLTVYQARAELVKPKN